MTALAERIASDDSPGRRTPGPAAIQLERSDQAVAEIAGRDGVIVPGVEYGVLAGDPVEVLEALGVEKVPSIGAG